MAEKIPSDYSDRIKTLRKRLGLTQAKMAERMGVAFATVNRWENRQTRPSALAWEKILRAEALGIDGLSDDFKGVDLVRDAALHRYTSEGPSDIDFSADSEVVRIVAEGERLRYGHLFNPAFAAEISLIDPLPHQRIAVYEHMLQQYRLRFLLADDAGAGKTIMAGLYIREMLARRLIQRVLIVPPAGLVGNWERELRRLFRLPFRIVSGGEARSGNPFVGPDSALLIVSVDTLAGERMFPRLQEPSVSPYDLVIFDEAHKLSADREPDFYIRKTARYRLAEALVGLETEDQRWKLDWSCHHLLLLTATPHMGKEFPYYCLWRLLEPEVFSTYEAFINCPAEERRRHFIRRTKEEMVFFDGKPIYPRRVSDTLSYDLSGGEIGEQTLYDETTHYIRTFYNRARMLNRSAARFAMSIFQRRLASSTYALMRSFDRRLAKLDAYIDDLRSGRMDLEMLTSKQNKLAGLTDVFDTKTADEEESEQYQEESEFFELQALEGVAAASLAELMTEREQVAHLLDLSRQVYEKGEESKFEKLREVLRGEDFRDEKIIIFTEHRDTLEFLVRRLEGLGFTGKVAQIHGGMAYQDRDDQVEFFRRDSAEGGANYLVATDAAGEGINLQFCWLMVNYDIPWNPARLEQRMGRIHRYGQRHDPVIIMNLVAGKTREGRVLKTLLTKLERIREELGSDKVFDVVGQLFEGVSIKEYMEQVTTEDNADEVEQRIDGSLTKEQVKALEARDKRLFGDGGDVKKELPRLREHLDQEVYCRLLPGYVRRFFEEAAPRMDIGIEGSLDDTFSLKALKPRALDPLWSVLETYPGDQRNRLTLEKPERPGESIWFHPGEPLFERFRAHLCTRFSEVALRGGVFVDPTVMHPYMYHLALVAVERQADACIEAFSENEVLEYHLVGLRQDETGKVEECPVEQLLLLKGGDKVPVSAVRFAATSRKARETVQAYVQEHIAEPLAEKRRQVLLDTLSVREDFIRRGYDYQEAELATARAKIREKARAGDPRAKGELTRIRDRQRALDARREAAFRRIRREPELIAPARVVFLAHALVVPSSDEEDKKRHDREVEAIAVKVAWAYEASKGAVVQDVSTSPRARAAGLTDNPGFDLLSKRPDGQTLGIEVKGRARIGDVELTENEWAKSCNLRDRYWLYVVYDCASSRPRLLRVQDPFKKLIARPKGVVVIGDEMVFEAAETEQ